MAATRYVPALDIWPLPPRARAALTPGQWVTAGPGGPRGRYLGQTRGGVDVVAWRDNARRGHALDYMRALRAYAQARA